MTRETATRRHRQRHGRRASRRRRAGPRRRRRFDITVFGDEPRGNYNRILLSGVLAGSHRSDDIFINPLVVVRRPTASRCTRACASKRSTSRAPSRSVAPNGRRRALRRARHRHRQPAARCRRSTASSVRTWRPAARTASSSSARSRTASASSRTRATRRRAARHRRRPARPRGRARAAEPRPRGPRRPPDAAPDGRAARCAGARRCCSGSSSRWACTSDLETATTAVLGDGTRHRPRVSRTARRSSATWWSSRPASGPTSSSRGRPASRRTRHRRRRRSRVSRRARRVRGRRVRRASRPRLRAGRAAVGAGAGARRPADRPQADARLRRIAAVDQAEGRRRRSRRDGGEGAVEEDDEVVSYAEPSRGIYKKLIVRNDGWPAPSSSATAASCPSLLQAFAESTLLADEPRRAAVPRSPSTARRSAPKQFRTPRRSATATACRRRRSSRRCSAARAACRPSATRRGPAPAAARAGPKCRRSSSWRAAASPTPTLLAAGEHAGRPAEVRVPAGADERRRDAEQDRAAQEREGRPRHRRRRPASGAGGWEAIDEGDRERLKWAGVFFRRQTPGRFMMRVRMSNGLTNAEQIATIARDHATSSAPASSTSRRGSRSSCAGSRSSNVPEIWQRLETVGLVSLQTGMDNIRNVVGCPAAGLTPHELFDASPIVARVHRDVPAEQGVHEPAAQVQRRHQRLHSSTARTPSRRISALTPAVKTIDGRRGHGFNVAVGGKMGSGGYRIASPLDVFVEPEDAAALCGQIMLIFRDHGFARVAHEGAAGVPVEAWGVAKFRARAAAPRSAGRCSRPARTHAAPQHADHLGIVKQKQAGLNYVGLAVPVGRITPTQLFEVARLADEYGNGDVRLTTGQNVIIPNVPDDEAARRSSPSRCCGSCRHDPPGVIRGLVSCTGIDYCHFALIETKELALKTARHLEQRAAGRQAVDDALVGVPGGLRQSRGGRHRAAGQERPDRRTDRRRRGRLHRRQVGTECEARHEDSRRRAV